MTSVAEEVHSRLEQEIAENYRRLDYTVYIEPNSQELPPFLQSFHPDIVAIKRGESGEIHEGIVAEVKTSAPTSKTLQQLERLIQAVQSQPGWRFEVVTRNTRETALLNALLPVLSVDQIKRKIEQAQRLAQEQSNENAFLILWTAVEALLRHQSRDEEVEIPYEGTLPLLSLLYTDGGLEEEDYKLLSGLYDIRNRLTHGFLAEDLTSDKLQQLSDIANRLLKWYPTAA